MLNNITTIIPIGEVTKDEINLLEIALNSIKNQKDNKFPSKVIVVCDQKSTSVLSDFYLGKNFDGLEIENIINDGSTSIQGQINKAIESVKTEYFTYLEFDDQFTHFYFKHVEAYLKSFPDMSVFLPLSAEMRADGVFLKYGNAECFSRDVSESIGFVTHDALMKLPMFSVSGGIFKVDDFIDLGKLKENIKYTFIYEYLLRITNQDQKIMVIPKLGYVHIFDRVNSFTNQTNLKLKMSELTQEELNFWFDTAKKEFYFKIDRKLEYKPKV